VSESEGSVVLDYANAMMHFLAGLPRLVFLIAPLAFLLLHAHMHLRPGVDDPVDRCGLLQKI
jgi:hypothetical protein